MPTPHTDKPLKDALPDFCRTNGRRLTADNLAAHGTEVLEALTGAPAPATKSARLPLAYWTVENLDELIQQLEDRQDRWIARVALAALSDQYGDYVGERVRVGVARQWFTRDQYWSNRRRVIDQIAADLALAYREHNWSSPYTPAEQPVPVDTTGHITVPRIFVAAYHQDSRYEHLGHVLGVAMAKRYTGGVHLVSMASRTALTIGYAMAGQSRMMNTYTPALYSIYRRTESPRPAPIWRNLGQTFCLDGSRNHIRRQIIGDCDIAIVLAGDNGTTYEAQLAYHLGKPVLPIAATGGSARKCYDPNAFSGLAGPATIAAYRDLAKFDTETLVPAAISVLDHLLDNLIASGPRRR
ncbi:hypothetical protein ACIA8C_21615 [Nocardia sp. NPDC051321]|uniref:hypothetical protein n=1 Tax=Nocardia sp. NPDC051321 TaxID=3364323 RepID=UPI00379FC1B0